MKDGGHLIVSIVEGNTSLYAAGRGTAEPQQGRDTVTSKIRQSNQAVPELCHEAPRLHEGSPSKWTFVTR